MFKQSRLISALVVTGVALASSQAARAEIIKIDGSSTVYPITEAVAEDFQKAMKNVIKVTVGISGTGGGFKKFCRDETDFQNASRPITTQEMEDCKAAGVEYIEMPVAYDALTVVINPKNTFLKQATVEELRKLWEPAAQGTIRVTAFAGKSAAAVGEAPPHQIATANSHSIAFIAFFSMSTSLVCG